MSRSRLISDGSNTPDYNMAADEALLLLHSGHAIPGTLRIWSFSSPVVCLGRNSIFSETARRDEMDILGITALRRFTGGGVTYNEPSGEVCWSFVTEAKGAMDAYRRCATAIGSALKPYGIQSGMASISDITVGGKKISGIAGAKSRDSVLVHGTLLIDPDGEVMDRVLRPFRNNGSEVPAASRITSLRRLTGRAVGREEVERSIAGGFSNVSDIEPGEWTALERDLIARLRPRYKDDAWTYRR